MQDWDGAGRVQLWLKKLVNHPEQLPVLHEAEFAAQIDVPCVVQ